MSLVTPTGSLDDIRLQNIHACAELSAFRFAASKGWTTITDGVVEFLIDLHIWTSQFPDIVLPWEGHAQTGDLRIQGQSQAYNRWLHVNQHALYAPYDWSSVEHPHAFGEDANIVHLRRSPSFVTGRRVHFPQLIFSPTSLLGIFRDPNIMVRPARYRITEVGEGPKVEDLEH
ncbi:hypothetical protein NLU13_8522 [Sarocladium strictum]|uniref:Uncharacterized protein n=1 Tax=Sarocladium strictum TaxID=5046 RepID=A0AA39L4R0_SARSR|nr:hypothetical protein NLU13_8522 [Sarocladium strictum]